MNLLHQTYWSVAKAAVSTVVMYALWSLDQKEWSMASVLLVGLFFGEAIAYARVMKATDKHEQVQR